jgi:mRNA interferase MazF
MGRFIKGDVVVVPFPFSDLSNSKKRPALVVADIEGNDLILVQITSQNNYDNYTIKVLETDFAKGSLKKTSNVRPNKIFTADEQLILYKVGHLTGDKIKEISSSIINIFSD